MPPSQTGSLSLLFLIYSFLTSLTYAQAAPSLLNTRDGKSPDSVPGSPLSPSALRDTTYLPAQIGGIVGAYAFSLVLVAIILLALSKKRRSHLSAGNDEVDFDEKRRSALVSPRFPRESSSHLPSELQTEIPPEIPPQAYEPRSASPSVPNFSYPSPIRTDFSNTGPNPYIFPSPVSSIGAPGVSPQVDQRVVAADRVMAQQQLEEMYKYVMEHDEAKQKGIVLDAPVLPAHQRAPTVEKPAATLTKKERSKPANLNLSATREDKTQSRTSSILSALRSPKKNSIRGVNISSPIMTPKSATFSQHESQEMNTIPPRHYAPPPPPPIPTDQIRFGAKVRTSGAPLTPDMSPESSQSIDERIGYQLGPYSYNHSRNLSQAPTEADPESATSEHSQAPLVGLPLSPKPRFSTLPASPKPGATFQRPNPPSAVRTGGALPLRAYEPAMNSPSAIAHTTKQTVFERKGPLSPSGNMTPYTAGAAPYSPYQPFTPCVPITPSLVTRDDRRRMKRMMPKTPTLEMVRSSEDIW